MSEASVNAAIMGQMDKLAKWANAIHELCELRLFPVESKTMQEWIDETADDGYESLMWRPDVLTMQDYLVPPDDGYGFYSAGLIKKWMKLHNAYARSVGYGNLQALILDRGFRAPELFGEIWYRETGARMDPHAVSKGIGKVLATITVTGIGSATISTLGYPYSHVSTGLFAPTPIIWYCASTVVDGDIKLKISCRTNMYNTGTRTWTNTYIPARTGETYNPAAIATIPEGSRGVDLNPDTGIAIADPDLYYMNPSMGHILEATVSGALAAGTGNTQTIICTTALPWWIVPGATLLIDGFNATETSIIQQQRVYVSAINTPSFTIAQQDLTVTPIANYTYDLAYKVLKYPYKTGAKIRPCFWSIDAIEYDATSTASAGVIELRMNDDRAPVF